MGSISDHTDMTDMTKSVEGTSGSTAPNKLDLNEDEIKFLLAKIAQLDFKGVEIEFAYNMIVKLQELYRQKVQ
jgi:hypothetical protein